MWYLFRRAIIVNTYLRASETRFNSQTDVIPANAPLTNRVGVSSCVAPLPVKNCMGRNIKTQD